MTIQTPRLTPAPGRARPRSPRHLVGLIGSGISRSLTPALHEREAAILGLDYEYRILDLDRLRRDPHDIGALLDDLEAEGYSAVNVTHPCKQLVIPALDRLSPDAERLGAVNLVLLGSDGREGLNTDWTGFGRALADGLPEVARERVVQFGAGGAGAATAYAALGSGVRELVLVDPDIAHADRLAAHLRELFPGHCIHACTPDVIDLSSVDGVIHATPIGMAQHPGVAFDVEALPSNAWLAEIVYRPLETELLRAARARGLRTLDGSRMAVGQAIDSLRLITDHQPDPERMLAHFAELVHLDGHAR